MGEGSWCVCVCVCVCVCLCVCVFVCVGDTAGSKLRMESRRQCKKGMYVYVCVCCFKS